MTLEMRSYDPSLTIAQARAQYFSDSGFGEETYVDRWVRLPVGPLTFFMPNIEARKICVPLHDIDHVLTGYPTSWRGELSIAGFEIGAGLGRFWIGWVINLQGLVLGGLRCPSDVFRAFVRGRRSGSLFRAHETVDDALLARTVGELRDELGIAPHPTADVTLGDRLAFAGWWGIAVASVAWPLVPLAAAWWLLR